MASDQQMGDDSDVFVVLVKHRSMENPEVLSTHQEVYGPFVEEELARRFLHWHTWGFERWRQAEIVVMKPAGSSETSWPSVSKSTNNGPDFRADWGDLENG